MPNHNVAAIANEFLRRAKAEGRPLTNMQLQKLPYIAHGWALAGMGIDHPLINEQPRAWRYGPVYPDLYRELKKYGSGKVCDYIRENDGCNTDGGPIIQCTLTPEETRLIDAIWNIYGNKDGIELSAITHLTNSPWDQIRREYGDAYIPNNIIEKYYSDLSRRNEENKEK
ncbi:Panacea domain-containing protein [Komagataeibacter sp. FXV3]|uniref:Panacea domain-containing protein n=1 Tax=Komagataeibacter sp. FXV3 TaxID=2608998 RepID=UPI00187B3818|nr:type II toxin-antitoxin system antitoxin SocA domain-containing protein [Komagataeibacter sp. FXV3]MBE7729426.1 DUF4065 domain-containing protein [Komagataeibacter sp. FXV3]